MHAAHADAGANRDRPASVRTRLERLLLWRVWERLLEIEFLDRSIALAGKAFVSFFPLVIVVAAFMPDGVRTSIITTVTHRLGMQGDALRAAREAFASTSDTREATGVLGLVLTIFFATSFTTALQRVYQRAWRRPPARGRGAYWRGAVWLVAQLGTMALLGAIRGTLDGPVGLATFAVVSIAATTGLWWFTSWWLLLGEVRPRVLIATGAATALLLLAYVLSATVWMPQIVSSNEEQFGVFGIALALVSWFSGAAICVLIGACAGPVLADDTGRVGTWIRGPADSTLTPGARPALAPPASALSLRDAFQNTAE